MIPHAARGPGGDPCYDPRSFMPTQALIVLALLGTAILVMATERVRPDLVALLLLVTLITSGLVREEDALSTLSGPAVIVLLGVFVLTGGLARSGAPARIGRALLGLSGRSGARLVLATMGAGALLSLFMPTIAAASLLMPAASHAAEKARLSSSRVLLPLAYATQLGGMATLFTTANIVASGVLRDHGYEGLTFANFFAVGGVAALAGIAWLAVAGSRLLPHESPAEELARVARLRRTLSEQYGLTEELAVLRVGPKARCVGRALAESGLGEALGLSVLAIERDRKTLLAPSRGEVLRGGDLLVVSGAGGRGDALEAAGLRVEPRSAWAGDLPAEALGLHEAIVAPRSRAVGRTIRELHFRSKYGLSVVALLREGKPRWAAVGSEPLRFGDALLLHGPASNVPLLRSDPDWVVLRFDPTAEANGRRVRVAGAILALAVGTAALGLVPAPAAILAGGLLMVLTGCLSMDEAYQVIDWRTIVLVAGMLPAGIALRESGAADALGRWIVGAAAGAGRDALLPAFLAGASLLAQVIPGGGATIPAVLGPIAIEAAREAALDPRRLVLAVALGTSTSFLSPFGHPVNAFVMGPGGYRARDFLLAGAPLALLVSAIGVWAIALFGPAGAAAGAR